MDELKKCPFCGGTPRMEHEGDWWFVQCVTPECATTGTCDLGESGAVESWNTRPTEDAQAAEIERLREAARWIPVGERLPEKGQRVIIFARNGWIGPATYFRVFSESPADLTDYWKHDAGDEVWHVTHWRPLPEPPQEPQS